MSYRGTLSRAYIILEGTYGQGDPTTDVQIPINKTRSLVKNKPQYSNVEEFTFDSLEPACVYTEELVPAEGPLGPFAFRDPFPFLLPFFSHKEVSGVWGTGTGVIDADFSDIDDVDSIGLATRVYDHVNAAHLDRLMQGGKVTQYRLMFGKKKLLQEQPTVKFTNYDASAFTTPSISNDFHGQEWGSGVGGFALWDDTGILGAKCARSSREVSITWGGITIPGISIIDGELMMAEPSETEQTFDKLYHDEEWPGQHDFQVVLNGKFKALDLIEEAEKTMENKTFQDLLFYIDSTVGAEKYIKCTQVYVDSHDNVDIPESGSSADARVVFKGGAGRAISYKGNFVDLPDPSALITLSP